MAEPFELETVNKLYLELSQFATADTAKETELRRNVGLLRQACERSLETLRRLAALPMFYGDNSQIFNRGGFGYDTCRAIEGAIQSCTRRGNG